jgi:hypothetical protein
MKFKVEMSMESTFVDGRVQQTGYIIHRERGRVTITCLRCQSISANPNDVENKYCGRCHRFHEEEGT